MTRRHERRSVVTCFAVLLLLVLWSWSWAAEMMPKKPSKQDKCPVCGMFVYKYPDWVGRVVFSDGSIAFFDGAKDLFKFYLDPKKYGSGRSRDEFREIEVTEYYGITLIRAQEAWFVLGSKVYGPMGKELIPLASEWDAQEFMKDHQGKRILRFHEILPEVMRELE